MISSTHPADIMKIISSSHPKPKEVLGLHMVEVELANNKTIVIPAIRTFQPHVKTAWIIKKSDNSFYLMQNIHKDGFFEALIWNEHEPFLYSYKFEDYVGNEYISDEAYTKDTTHITKFDRYLFNRALHYKIYEKMGSHLCIKNNINGVQFAVWAPNAQRVSIVGDFNLWDGRKHQMNFLEDSGVWQLFIPHLQQNARYKYEIKTQNNEILLKADPYANYAELRPQTASIISSNLNDYTWTDEEWIKKRTNSNYYENPTSIYELHIGSWKKKIEENNRFLTYRELVIELIPFLKYMNYTHIELMPISEYPYDGSWGYQCTGYFSPTCRYGTPEDLQYFVDECHKANIGVILDWVPGHFARDLHALINFDGTALYEHHDIRKGEHLDWGTKIFNYGRYEVKNFLIGSALFWIDKFHFDGLRVDAVASMLYLDYSRTEWIPNIYGGREHLEAIDFLKHLNSIVSEQYPGVLMIAEESTSWGGVSKPVYVGGLGFSYKWNMGWMNDTLRYMSKNSIYKKYHHGDLTFSFLYAWSENFVLPISHDEVVHGKGSMISKMPGDYWQKFANLRAFYTYMWGHPGKKLLFMGQDFAQFNEWNSEQSLDWHLLEFDAHKGMLECIKDLNNIYISEKACYELDNTTDGFIGLNCDDRENSVISFMRRSKNPFDFLIFVINFTPIIRHNYSVGIPENCFYNEIFNSDATKYFGSNCGNNGGLLSTNMPNGTMPYCINITIPPLAGLIFKPYFENKGK